MTRSCRACQTGKLNTFLDLGLVPPVNAFLTKEELPHEEGFPLVMARCESCSLAQLVDIVPPEKLFSRYLHLSSGSEANLTHLRSVADMVKERLRPTSSSKILEIGCNDGSLLACLKKISPHVLGVDPAKNLGDYHKRNGVRVVTDFFNTATAEQITKKEGLFDIIIGLNVVPHTPDVVNLLKAVHLALTDNGTFIMEGVYAIETILKGEFDTVYHEHVYCFSLHALINTFKGAGLTVVDVERIPTQGGSLRVLAQKIATAKAATPRVTSLLEEEKKNGFLDDQAYERATAKAVHFRNELRNLVETVKKKNGSLVGLGAPARGVVILNYCGLRDTDLDFIVDDTPLKQGKHTPGVHIPVASWNAVNPEKHSAFLLLSWNYKDSILKKLRTINKKADVIIPFPLLTVETIG